MSARVAMPREVTAPRVAITVYLAGCGGSGSRMLLRLASMDRALRALGHAGLHLIAYDPDTVSAANVGRQAFYPADVGCNKAHVLVFRLNACLGTSYEAHARRFDATPDRTFGSATLVVSCVDTAAARRDIGAQLSRGTWGGQLFWLDLGNDAHTGQAVLGQPKQERYRDWKYRLPTVLELYPHLMDANRVEDDVPSCSLAEALERQDLFVNELVVGAAANLLWQALREGELRHSAVFINARTHQTAGLPIAPAAWRRFGHRMGRCKPPTAVTTDPLYGTFEA